MIIICTQGSTGIVSSVHRKTRIRMVGNVFVIIRGGINEGLT